MYILSLTYQKPLEDVNRTLPAHRDFLEKYYALNKFICSGPKEPRTGGIILATFDSLEEVQQTIKEDPFYQEKIASYHITEFHPTKKNDCFKDIL